MRVLYILPISWGGIPHYTAELVNAVSKYADVMVIKPKDSNDELFSENVEIINIFEPIRFSRGKELIILSANNIKRYLSYGKLNIINKLKPHIVHFTNLYPHSSLFMFLYKLHKNCPVICTLHSTFRSLFVPPSQYGFIWSIIHFISMFTRRMVKSNAIIVHTKQNKDDLIENGVDPRKIFVISHGSFNIFKNYIKDVNNIVESTENCVLFFGYIQKNKGLEYFINAIHIASKKVPNIKAIIAGEGDMSKYRKIIEDKSKFEIHNRFIPNDIAAYLFQRSKIIVLPYTYHQGHSGVLLTALSFGKPIIVTNVGSLPELVENGKYGIVVPPRDPEALADAIIKILEDDRLRKKMLRNALKRAEELSWDNIAKKHLKVYKEVIDMWGEKIGNLQHL